MSRHDWYMSLHSGDIAVESINYTKKNTIISLIS